MKVFKYQIPMEDFFELLLPKNSEILSFRLQNYIPCIWVLVDEDNLTELEKYWFRLVGTGHPLHVSLDPEKRIFIGTIQDDNLMWHLFYIK